jgi:hypothetical protein
MTTEVSQIPGLDEIADSRVRLKVREFSELVRRRFPEARFSVGPHPSHRGAVIDAFTNVSDDFELLDLVVDRLLDLLIEEDIAIQVIPMDLAWYPPTA